MSILVEDTARNNLAAWVVEALSVGVVTGATTSPFSSPFVNTTYKSSCDRIMGQIRDGGGEVWFDAATYAIAIPGAGDFRYYDQWDLWGGDRGDSSTPVLLRDHVVRVLAAQSRLGAQALAPTVLLPSTATGPELDMAVAMATEALLLRPDAYLTIAGSPTFWSGGSDLDAYIGTIAQLGAPGYFLNVVRSTTDLPPQVDGEEVAGLCRTSRSLAQFGKVHISHGDFACMPAVAAGATSLGTGWDSRQRVCSHSSYLARDPTAGGAGWFKQPTFCGLFGSLSRVDAERFFNQNPSLATSLHVGALHPDGPKEAFLHHARSLGRVIATISAAPSPELRYRVLAEMYRDALNRWPAAAAAAGIRSKAGRNVDPFFNGLNSYAADEGWV